MTDGTDVESICQNSPRLLRQVRIAQIISVVALIGTGGSFIRRGEGEAPLAVTGSNPVLECQRLVLKDELGKTRADLRVVGDHVLLSLQDASEDTKSFWMVSPEDSRIVLKNRRGDSASISVDEDGPRLSLSTWMFVDGIEMSVAKDGGTALRLGRNMKKAADDTFSISALFSLLTRPDGTTAMAFMDNSGNTKGMWYNDENGTLLGLGQESNHTRILLHVSKDGTPGILLSDNKDKIRAALGPLETTTTRTGVTHLRPVSSILLLDEDGKVLFEAP